MPNMKGGKAYKKTKHGGDEEPVFVERAEDQMYGRMIRNLGGLNILVYCNDGKERICKIRGSMRKRTWMNVGDIVIISLRDLGSDVNNPSRTEDLRADIVAKCEPKFYSKIRKEPGTNDKLFVNIESLEESKRKNGGPDDEGGFIMEDDEENKVVDGEEDAELSDEDIDNI